MILFRRIAAFHDRDDGAQRDFVVMHRLLVDDHRILQHVLQRQNAAFYKRLLVLGIVVLGVLVDVAFFHRRVQTLGHLLAAHGLQMMQFFFQFLLTFFGQKGRLLGHGNTSSRDWLASGTMAGHKYKD